MPDQRYASSRTALGQREGRPPAGEDGLWACRRWSCVLLLAFSALFLAGCVTPAPLKGRADLLAFLADGRTPRQEVLLALGQPSGRFEGERILTYRLAYEPRNQGYWVVEREVQPTGWPTWYVAKYSLVLVFDASGILQRHSLVEVN